MARRPAVAAVAAGVLLLGGGCAVERLQGWETTPPAEVTLVVDERGPWTEVASAEPLPSGTPPAGGASIPPEIREAQAAVRAAAPPILGSPAAPKLAPPERRTTSAPPPRGSAPTRSPAELARERHLMNPTRIQAQRISFRCPARYAGEIRRTADAVAEGEGPGAVVLTGHARLTCRELTLEADRILLEFQPAGVEDVHVTAKGNASFVTVQRDQVLRQEGARSILVTNDRVLPLR